MKTITTCAGIGDAIWLIMKLINQPDKFNWVLPNGNPQRGKQLFDLLPQVTESCKYMPGLTYKLIKQKGFRGEWKNIGSNTMLEANTHLEAGKRIELFLPDLSTSYVLPYVTNTTALELPSGKLIGIYTSAYNNARQWNGWQAKEWLRLIRLIGPDYKFVFIGADWDIGVSQEIMAQMNPDEYVNTIGQPLPVVVEVLKRLDCFIGFPSGLSILNETLGAKQTVMFYPPHLQAMQVAWADPARIESGQYKGCQFCEPQKIYDWLKDRI